MKLSKIASSLLFAVGLLFVPSSTTAQTTVVVERIKDGDTFLTQNNQSIRLACIDAPESRQTGGQAATKHLAHLIPPGTQVQIVPVERDRFGRTVAVVYQNSNINQSMVKAGHAAVYRQYLNNCSHSRQALLAAEQQAKQQNRGMWHQENPCMPWDFRSGNCNSARSQPANDGSCDPSYPDVCLPSPPPDLDCGDISERRFRVRGADPHRFDGDNDGIGCES